MSMPAVLKPHGFLVKIHYIQGETATARHALRWKIEKLLEASKNLIGGVKLVVSIRHKYLGGH